jgi:hypothetical protein
MLNQYGEYYVVADTLFDTLEPTRVRMFYVFDVKEWKTTKETGERLTALLSQNERFSMFVPLAHDLYVMNQG